MHDSCLKAESGISALVHWLYMVAERPDQMLAHSALALHPAACLPAAGLKLAISLADVIFLAMGPGLVYNGLLTAKPRVSLGDQAGSVGRDLGISILPAPLLHQS